MLMIVRDFLRWNYTFFIFVEKISFALIFDLERSFTKKYDEKVISQRKRGGKRKGFSNSFYFSFQQLQIIGSLLFEGDVAVE